MKVLLLLTVLLFSCQPQPEQKLVCKETVKTIKLIKSSIETRYGYNNGYYSSKLDLIITNNKDFHKVFNISECQNIEG